MNFDGYKKFDRTQKVEYRLTYFFITTLYSLSIIKGYSSGADGEGFLYLSAKPENE